MRRSLLYRSGIFCLTILWLALLFDQARHQAGKFEQIDDPERRAALPDHDLKFGSDDVGPLPRHRAEVVVVDS